MVAGCRHLRRRNEGCVAHPYRIGRPAAALPVGKRRARNIARRQGHGKTDSEGAIVVMQVFEVFDFDNDPFPRRYVCHGRREKVRALLFDEAGLPAFATCALIVLPRLFLLPDFSLDKTLADMQPHAIDRRLVRQWKYVDALDPLSAFIAKFLADRHACNEAAYGHRDFSVRAGRRDDPRLHFQEQRAGLYVCRPPFLARCDRHPQPGNRNDHYHQCFLL